MIRKFFGRGDVFIYATSNINLKGKKYLKDEQIAYFSDVSLSLEYLLDHKQAMTSGRELSYVERHPQVLNINNVPNTDELEKIFFENSSKEEVSYSIIDKYKDIKGKTIFLKRNESPVKVKTFSNGKELISTLNDDNTVTLEDNYKSVEVISTFVKEGERRGFDKPHIGYVKIKATIAGKVGDEEGLFLLEIPLADLVSEPQMDLTEDSNYNVFLSFALINKAVNKPTVVRING